MQTATQRKDPDPKLLTNWNDRTAPFQEEKLWTKAAAEFANIVFWPAFSSIVMITSLWITYKTITAESYDPIIHWYLHWSLIGANVVCLGSLVFIYHAFIASNNNGVRRGD